jgi:hypothetical protein
LERLAALVKSEGGLLADALYDDATRRADGATPYGDAIASAPRANGHIADLPLVIEAVREGYLLHYGEPRLMSREDDDLALLAGDRLYALGLEGPGERRCAARRRRLGGRLRRARLGLQHRAGGRQTGGACR